MFGAKGLKEWLVESGRGGQLPRSGAGWVREIE